MHDDDDFPEHEHFPGPGEDAGFEDVEGLEKFSLRSVGIDIGSSTSHLVFSRLTLRRKGGDLSSRFDVTERVVLYRSPIWLTPYSSSRLIDVAGLRERIDSAYAEAGLTPERIDTGAVLITGEALNKENARPIAEMFARHSGKFICVSAGPHHEALLAAYGSGAVALSNHDHSTVLNVDIGGGTSKLSLIRNGVVLLTQAISVGARLVAVDGQGTITRLEDPARLMLETLGTRADTGDRLGEDQRRNLAELMADALFELIERRPESKLGRALMVTEPWSGYAGPRGVDGIVFSGGVSEYIYEREPNDYGDLGLLLGRAIRSRLTADGLTGKMRPAAEGIRATVIGAGEYTVQVSGTTSYLSDISVLPVFALRVVKAAVGEEPAQQSLERALRKTDLERFQEGLALALAIERQPDYRLLRDIAVGVRAVLDGSNAPLFLLLDADVAKALGGILIEELGFPSPVIALDGIDVGDLDYVDVGRPLENSESVPVTVKSLIFPSG